MSASPIEPPDGNTGVILLFKNAANISTTAGWAPAFPSKSVLSLATIAARTTSRGALGPTAALVA
ncbi:hypothetical protein Ljam_1052 [Legionella jamestowniensis]|uniref:Uncharacterized protein n=1 Tax=Legionella jamestowniensis TaxID=455 RepID=A0A0W0UH35_9GAMM|nr:hypothetical protein Ljam_1052 [Legionella jamestowniensis]